MEFSPGWNRRPRAGLAPESVQKPSEICAMPVRIASSAFPMAPIDLIGHHVFERVRLFPPV